MTGLFDLTGKTALVTGGSVGIGNYAARGLASAGAEVCLVSRDAEDGARAVEEIIADGGKAFFVSADLATRRRSPLWPARSLSGCRPSTSW